MKNKKEEVVTPAAKEQVKDEKPKPPKSIFKQAKNPNFRFGKPETEVIEILGDEEDR